MTSRLPSILPAYKDNQLYYFDETSLKARDYLYPSNYGMIPINLIIDKPPLSCRTYSFTDCVSAYTTASTSVVEETQENVLDLVIEDGDAVNNNEIVEETYYPCSSSTFTMSFERLSNWYYKFKEYYHLLNDYGHCGIVYTSAQEYYKNESQRYPQDMVYGVDEDTYIALDEELSRMGACVSSITYCCGEGDDEKCYIQAVDNGFYKWINDNIIPTFTIPKPYQDYWKRTTLYYPDVISWVGWFEDRNAIYSSYTKVEDCRELATPKLKEGDSCHYEEGDCCECKEYVNRGGLDMYHSLTRWYDGVQTAISGINEIVSANIECFVPTVISPLSIQGNLHTNGEMTVLCEEYELDVDYRTASGFGATENDSVGAIVRSGDTLLRLVSGCGYTYDEKYMETIFDENGWENAYTLSSTTSAVTGYTSSKLKSIHVTNYLVDDVGNTIYGIYEPDSGKTNYQPPIYTELEPIYQIGRISNISRVSTSGNVFIGDEIDSMVFYYKTTDGVDGTRYSGTSEGCLSAITEATINKDSGETYYDDIFCDVTYHIGNIYETDESGFVMSVSAGVEYNETVNFVKEKVEYYLKKKKKIILPFNKKKIDNHSISYPIYVYTLKQETERIDDNTYDVPYEDNLATFSATIERPFINDWESGLTECGEYSGTTLSGDTYLPLFLEEYKLGSAAPQNVKGDIYIDRGINAAFEKHLKLGEVTTLEALMQYGNNYFKITDK